MCPKPVNDPNKIYQLINDRILFCKTENFREPEIEVLSGKIYIYKYFFFHLLIFSEDYLINNKKNQVYTIWNLL